MVDSDTSPIGTITNAETSLNVRKEFPENWIWLSIDVTNETGYGTECENCMEIIVSLNQLLLS